MTTITNELEAVLTKTQKEFAKSMFIDTRLTQPLFSHIIREPAGLQDSLDRFDQYKFSLGNVIRKERPDLSSLAKDIDETQDTLERIALWAIQFQPSTTSDQLV